MSNGETEGNRPAGEFEIVSVEQDRLDTTFRLDRQKDRREPKIVFEQNNRRDLMQVMLSLFEGQKPFNFEYADSDDGSGSYEIRKIYRVR